MSIALLFPLVLVVALVALTVGLIVHRNRRQDRR